MFKLARTHRHRVLMFLAVILAVVLVLPAANCAPKAPEGAVPVTNVRIHSQMPIGHYLTESIDLFIKEAEARSKGTLKFTHYPAMQLHKDIEMVDVLPKGGVEMAQISSLMFLGKVPELGAVAAFGLYKDYDHAVRATYDVEHGGGLTPKVLEPGFQKANIKLLSYVCYATSSIIATTKPVHKVEDYKGLRIRSLGKTVSVVIESLGAAPVLMSAADMYMGLQRGVIDGVLTGATSIYERKLYEVVKHLQDFDLWMPSAFSLAANLDFWNKLAPSQQKAILEAALIAETYSTERAIQGEAEARKALKDKGIEVYRFSGAELDRFYGIVRPAIIQMIKKDYGEEKGGMIIGMIEATRDAKTTWKKCYEINNKRLMAEIK